MKTILRMQPALMSKSRGPREKLRVRLLLGATLKSRRFEDIEERSEHFLP